VSQKVPVMKNFLRKLYPKLPIVRELNQIRSELWSMKVNETLRLLDFGLTDHPRYGDKLRLLRYQSQVSSQNGEDGMIHEIFRRIGKTNEVFAEVGAGNGIENNTSFLVGQGWSGFWVDAEAELVDVLARLPDHQRKLVKYHIGLIDRENIAGIFEQMGVPREFDLLSLDIDQNTYYAWEGLSDYRPRVVVIEYNASIPADLDWKVPYDSKAMWDLTINSGAGLKAFENLGRELGYSLVGCDFLGVNAFFVREDLVGARFSAPFTSENHHEPPRYSMLSRRGHKPAILHQRK
jgi:hypothetical protein